MIFIMFSYTFRNIAPLMEEFKESLLILISTPIYAVVIGAEILFSYLHKHGTYTVNLDLPPLTFF
jgi:hypothetical protein